ncbi:sorbitol dehydrogenase [Dactylonectria macrodidyma]|uniref:Sorbitol dehydrogenase n=1 Tax=Dactylonectria macrodidyma TaxID=307937 RepID=A0A9P9IQG6_9HYPO|nr:sorbitol dehydrogenase [Dactylonectria macrodidyma]
MSYEEGSLLEPLSVALAGIERSGVRLGDPMLICGAGPIGIVTLLAASAAGANPIAITGINETRLAFAKSLVPRANAILVLPEKKPAEAAKDVKQTFGQEAKLSCRFGGMVFVIGYGKDFQTLPLSTKEIDLRFQYRYHDTYPRAIGLVASGVIDVKSLVTHRFHLEESELAFRTASDPRAMAVKVQILDE